jgi:hypothetical protein
VAQGAAGFGSARGIGEEVNTAGTAAQVYAKTPLVSGGPMACEFDGTARTLRPDSRPVRRRASRREDLWLETSISLTVREPCRSRTVSEILVSNSLFLWLPGPVELPGASYTVPERDSKLAPGNYHLHESRAEGFRSGASSPRGRRDGRNGAG